MGRNGKGNNNYVLAFVYTRFDKPAMPILTSTAVDDSGRRWAATVAVVVPEWSGDTKKLSDEVYARLVGAGVTGVGGEKVNLNDPELVEEREKLIKAGFCFPAVVYGIGDNLVTEGEEDEDVEENDYIVVEELDQRNASKSITISMFGDDSIPHLEDGQQTRVLEIVTRDERWEGPNDKDTGLETYTGVTETGMVRAVHPNWDGFQIVEIPEEVTVEKIEMAVAASVAMTAGAIGVVGDEAGARFMTLMALPAGSVAIVLGADHQIAVHTVDEAGAAATSQDLVVVAAAVELSKEALAVNLARTAHSRVKAD